MKDRRDEQIDVFSEFGFFVAKHLKFLTAARVTQLKRGRKDKTKVPGAKNKTDTAKTESKSPE